ncbi:TIGR02217 family protein [Rhizobium sp. KVB221]|uniref:TIGR02217 family protein n=1 Tax=Rhizobium setariae TaxID=2801340 RepID=A0A937CNE0_9HYPH|nr:TIGR02217 family protein [Rhizobium setariae]MBL0371078.1 TIGR02217 family protein [Rhizobium setariae]
MTSFHEVQFPLRLALGTSGGPSRRTDIVSLSNGRESRNRRWKDARRHYDVGSGLRSVVDLYEVQAFFEARAGQLYGFRFTDPVDFKSCGPQQQISAADQHLGTGNGERRIFQLRKTYQDAGGATERVIAKPVAETVVMEVGDVVSGIDDFAVDPSTGLVTFSVAATPPDGAVIRAGFHFDVPVRFDIDRIEIDLNAFDAGRIPSIPLIEIMP